MAVDRVRVTVRDPEGLLPSAASMAMDVAGMSSLAAGADVVINIGSLSEGEAVIDVEVRGRVD